MMMCLMRELVRGKRIATGKNSQGSKFKGYALQQSLAIVVAI